MNGAGSQTTVYLAFGSNLGNRVAAIRTGVAVLAEQGFSAETFSSLYHSPPKYITEQPPFVNMVGRFRTGLAPRAVLTSCKRAEDAAGRRGRERHGPRELDVDVLLYGELIFQEEGLQIPHAGIAERLFVLVPLVEIEPALQIPGLGSAAGLLDRARKLLEPSERPVSLGSFEPGRGKGLEGGPR